MGQKSSKMTTTQPVFIDNDKSSDETEIYSNIKCMINPEKVINNIPSKNNELKNNFTEKCIVNDSMKPGCKKVNFGCFDNKNLFYNYNLKKNDLLNYDDELLKLIFEKYTKHYSGDLQQKNNKNQDKSLNEKNKVEFESIINDSLCSNDEKYLNFYYYKYLNDAKNKEMKQLINECSNSVMNIKKINNFLKQINFITKDLKLKIKNQNYDINKKNQEITKNINILKTKQKNIKNYSNQIDTYKYIIFFLTFTMIILVLILLFTF